MASREAVAGWVGAAVAALLAAGALAAVTHGTRPHDTRPRDTRVAPEKAATTTAAKAASVQTLRDETDNLAVAVPAGWQSPTGAPGSYADMIDSFVARNPQFRSIASQRLAKATATVGLFAVDPRSHTSMVIESAAAAPDAVSGPGAHGVLPGLLVDQYEKLGIQVLDTGTVRLPLGPVLHAALGLTVAGKDLVASQYFIDDGARVITVTIEGPGGTENLAIHDVIAHSIHR